MESLLSLSFDYLSSYDGSKIRKGLRQLEGLLAQICLSPTTTTTKQQASSSTPISIAEKRRSVATTTSKEGTPKELSQLRDDPAFREFFKLQEGFEWNVAIRLVACLERLLGRGSNGQNDLLIVLTLDTLHGILLIHPPSRTLFVREIYMNLLLDLLDPISCPAIQSSTLLTLVTALLNQPCNTRTFEALDGLLTVTSLFKSRGTSREVKMKSVEFLYFYLMPEAPAFNNQRRSSVRSSFGGGGGSLSNPSQQWDLSSRRLKSGGGGGKEDASNQGHTRSTAEKQALLGRHLSNVEDLVEDLRESATVGGLAAF